MTTGTRQESVVFGAEVYNYYGVVQCAVLLFDYAALAVYRLQRIATHKCGIYGVEAYNYHCMVHCEHLVYSDFAVLVAYQLQRVS